MMQAHTAPQDTRAANRPRRAMVRMPPRTMGCVVGQWERATGHPLRVTDGDDERGAMIVPIEGGGQLFAVLTSDAHYPALEPWVHGVGSLIGEMLAVDDELDGMTDELVDSYDQLTFLYEIARMLSTTSTLADALTMLLAQARRHHRRGWRRVGRRAERTVDARAHGWRGAR